MSGQRRQDWQPRESSLVSEGASLYQALLDLEEACRHAIEIQSRQEQEGNEEEQQQHHAERDQEDERQQSSTSSTADGKHLTVIRRVTVKSYDTDQP